jgi:amino acid transporter
MQTSSKNKALSVFSLTMITVGSVDSIRNLPATALFGSELIVFFILGALFFLLPAALVSAELSSQFPKQGGIYVWVKEAFGQRLGFLAIWLQWIENVIWYPTILAFVAGTIAYLISPSLSSNKYFLIGVILSSFWGVTLINLKGMKSSAFFSNLCTTTGLLLPMTLIIGLGAAWVFSGNPLQINFSLHSLIPAFHNSEGWTSLTAIMLSFCGIEIATVHANDVNNPQKAFPRALGLSVLIILVTLVLGSLTIAMVLPHSEISLVAGIMQAFHAFLSAYHLLWLMPFMAFMLVLGGLGSVNNWIIAPTQGLLVAARDGNLPKALQKTNANNAPQALLLYQALIVSVLCSAFLLMPSVNSAYWFLTALAAQLYMLMYILMFASAIQLRRTIPLKDNAFKIAGGFKGLVFVSGIGLLGTLTTFVVSFMPPNTLNVGGLVRYETALIMGLIIMCLPPFLSALLKRSSWKTVSSK